MNETKLLLEKIKEGIQEKKGKNIVIADLTGIRDTICNYFVICQETPLVRLVQLLTRSKSLPVKERMLSLLLLTD